MMDLLIRVTSDARMATVFVGRARQGSARFGVVAFEAAYCTRHDIVALNYREANMSCCLGQT